MLFLLLQSPRNGEDLSDGEAEVEAGSHDEAMGAIPRESSPEDGLGGGAAAVGSMLGGVCFEGELNFNKSAGSDNECLRLRPCSSLTPRKCEIRPPFEESSSVSCGHLVGVS